MNTPFENDPFAMVHQAFQNLYPGKQCQILWGSRFELQEEGKPAYGVTDFGEDGQVAVFVSSGLVVADAVEILAHELAHVAAGVEHDHDDVWEAAFEAIFQEYNRIGDELYGNEKGGNDQ